MEQKLRNIIAAHNRMIETIQDAGITCNLFRGMEIWDKIACEGADIVHAARSIGIDAKVYMQSGKISVPLMKNNDALDRWEEATKQYDPNLMPLSEIIDSLEDQAQYRDSLADSNGPDSIFRHDAAALRATIDILRKLEAQ